MLYSRSPLSETGLHMFCGSFDDLIVGEITQDGGVIYTLVLPLWTGYVLFSDVQVDYLDVGENSQERKNCNSRSPICVFSPY